MNRHKSASDAELRHQTETMMRERAHLAELQRIEEEISRQRLATLTSLENAAKDEMELMDRVRLCRLLVLIYSSEGKYSVLCCFRRRARRSVCWRRARST